MIYLVLVIVFLPRAIGSLDHMETAREFGACAWCSLETGDGDSGAS